MKTKWTFIFFLFFGFTQSLLLSCASSQRHVAINKQEAAFFYYQQGDYKSTKTLCQESIGIWKSIKNSYDKHVPDWHIDSNIQFCEELIDELPNTKTLETPARIPIRIVRKAIFIEAVLNNQEHATLLFDTGASVSVINEEVAEQLGIKPEKDAQRGMIRVVGGEIIEMPYSRLSEIAVGHAVVNNLNVGVFSAFPDEPWIDGILGADFLGNFTVTIDHDSKQLRLEN